MPNLNDVVGWIEDLKRQMARLKSGAFLENSSITSGRMRFIGGLLRVDSGGRVEIVGTLQVDGETNVTGTFTVSGPWQLTGDGTITGDVTVSGTVDLTGTMRVTGDIEILGPGKIKVGNVIIEDGKIKAGGMTIDPDTNGGQIDFGNGRFVNAGSGYLGVYDGDRFVVFNASGVTLNAGGRSITVGPGGIRGTGLTTITEADSGGHKPGAMYVGADGIWYRVVPD